MNKKTNGKRMVQLRIQNSPRPPVLPNERKHMAKAKAKKANKKGTTSKAKNKGKSKSRNTAKITQAPSAAMIRSYVAAAGGKVANRKKKGKHKHHRNTGGILKNGFSFAGIDVKDVALMAGSLIVTSAVAQALSAYVNPNSWAGISLQAGFAFGLAWGVPKNWGRDAIVAGAAITPMASLINRLTGNAIPNTVRSTLASFLPAQAAAAAATGVSGPRRVVRNY